MIVGVLSPTFHFSSISINIKIIGGRIMIHIKSRHIINAIRESCPLHISFSLNSITLLPPSNESKAFGVARFENDEKEKEVSCQWYVNVMPEMTELVIRWIGKEELFWIEL